jgi:hypothetical protein
MNLDAWIYLSGERTASLDEPDLATEQAIS